MGLGTGRVLWLLWVLLCLLFHHTQGLWNGRVFLTATFSAIHDLDLVEPFVDHYLGRGLKKHQFLLSLHVPRKGAAHVVGRGMTDKEIHRRKDVLVTALQSRGIKITNTWHDSFSAQTNLVQRLEVLSNYTRRHDWILIADSDELQDYPMPIHDYLKGLEKEGVNVVMGKLVDRVARDCRLHDVTPTPSIFEQFPCNANITKHVLEGMTGKIVAHKGFFRATAGNHKLFSQAMRSDPNWKFYFPRQPKDDEGDTRPIPARKAAGVTLTIHHFKWRNLVIEKLRARAKQYREKGIGAWVESARFLEYFNSTNGVLNITGCPC